MSALGIAALIVAAASAVFGGAMFAFSSFVMPGLRRLDPRKAVAAMQAINEAAPAGIVVPMFVSGIGGLAVGIWALAGSAPDPARLLLCLAAVASLAAFGITVGYHVPRNTALASATDETAAAAWKAYAPGWVTMNHVRALLSLVGSGLAIAGAVAL